MKKGLKLGLFKKATELVEAIHIVIHDEVGTPESEKEKR